ncbi:MAG: tetratricopeptide repeat protein [Desulfovibrionaceae bacterium]
MAEAPAYSILVADPSAPMLGVLQKIVAGACPAAVVTSTDMEAAVAAVASGSVQCAIVDWAFIEANDFALVGRLRDAAKGRSLPLLVMLGGVEQDKILKAARAGVRHFIVKPFRPEALRAKLVEAGLVFDAGTPRQAPETAAADDPAVREIKAKKLFAKGFELLQRRKFADAATLFLNAAKLQEAFPEAYKGVAEAMKGKGDLAASHQFLTKAAEAYVVQGRAAEAKQLYTDLCKANPATHNPFKTVGAAHAAQGDHAKAAACYEEAVAIAPKDTEAVMGLANAAAKSGDKERAVTVVRAALERGCTVPEATDLYSDLTGKDWFMESAAASAEKLQVLEHAKPATFEEKRQFPRMPLADYFVQVEGRGTLLQVVNICQGGFSFKAPDGGFAVGAALRVDLVGHETVKIKKIEVTVRHVDKGMVGCQFKGLDKKQAKLLEALMVQERPIGFKLDGNVNFDIPMM